MQDPSLATVPRDQSCTIETFRQSRKTLEVYTIIQYVTRGQQKVKVAPFKAYGPNYKITFIHTKVPLCSGHRHYLG